MVLNACYSETQANAIAEHIPYVIGMNAEISDAAALEFSTAFYDALGAGKNIEFAHATGCNAIQMAGIPEHLVPVLISGKALGERYPKEKSTQKKDNIEKRILDAALPTNVHVGTPTQLLVMIRLADSAGLRKIIEHYAHQNIPFDATEEDVKNSPEFLVEFKLDEEGNPISLSLLLKIRTTDFNVLDNNRKLLIHPKEDSPLCTFEATPIHSGTLDLSIDVFLYDTQVGTGFLRVNGKSRLEDTVGSMKKLVSLAIGVFSKSQTRTSTQHTNVIHICENKCPDNINISGIQGSLSLESSLHTVTKIIDILPNVDAETKAKLEHLFQQFSDALRQIPHEKAQDADVVDEMVKQVLTAFKNDNKPLFKIIVRGLEEALKSFSDVAPTVVDIVRQILDLLDKFIHMKR